ncbi:MAG: hypothetical protein JW940_02695 [Polyangiaceae bacterium]|nr:hypothetical protein [Polyangiaceae bacterium]
MTLRSGHGNGAGVPRIEVLPPDELPAGVPGPARPEAVRDSAGRFVPGAGTKAIARTGGLARASSLQLAQLLGLWTPPEDHPYAPYARMAREWRDGYMAQLAASVGGGQIGAGVAALISSAAIQLGASRWLHDTGARDGDAKALGEASKLADASRQNVLASFELAAKDARSRPQRPEDLPWFRPAPKEPTP